MLLYIPYCFVDNSKSIIRMITISLTILHNPLFVVIGSVLV